MITPPAPQPSEEAFSLREVAEFAWRIATQSPSTLREPAVDDATLLQCWSVARRLAQQWNERLNQLATPLHAASPALPALEFHQLATELFLCDLAFRVAATLIAGREAAHLASATWTPDGMAVAPASRARPVLTQALEHLGHTRVRVLELILATGDGSRTVERLRRCCERWTDLLIGPWIIVCGIGEHAYDARRAWDFGEDNATDFATPHGRQLLYASFQQALRGTHLQGKLPAASGNVLRQLLQQLLTHPTELPTAPATNQAVTDESPIEARLRELLRKAPPQSKADHGRSSPSVERSDVSSPEDTLLDRCLRRLKGDRYDPQ